MPRPQAPSSPFSIDNPGVFDAQSEVPAGRRVPSGDEPTKGPPRHIVRPPEDYTEIDEEMVLQIGKHEFPAGFDFQWVTEAVWGRPELQHRARFERAGWIPVHNDDFENKFRGRWVPWEYQGEIKQDGLVLMARSMSWTIKARESEARRANQRVQIKEQQLRQGALEGVTLSPQHPTAVRSNIVERSIDTISMPVPNK
jgi:hypothetical protein